MKSMLILILLVGTHIAELLQKHMRLYVGYQNITINPGFNMIAFNFQPMDNDQDNISIQDFVQNKADLVAGTSAGTSDQIQVWDGTKFTVYFYRMYKSNNPNKFTLGPAWVASSSATAPTTDTIKRGSGVWFARPTDKDAGVITVSGAINSTSKTHDILAGFNMISSAFPCDFKFNGGAIDWEACGAVAGTSAGTSDQIQVWDGSKFTVYFYRQYKSNNPNKFTLGPAWVASSSATAPTTDTIPAGKGFWYARPSTSAAGTLVEQSPIAPASAE